MNDFFSVLSECSYTGYKSKNRLLHMYKLFSVLQRSYHLARNLSQHLRKAGDLAL
jgi:hypothetical protein